MEPSYKNTSGTMQHDHPGGAANFHAFRVEDVSGQEGLRAHYASKDFYKISLVNVPSIYHHDGRHTTLPGPSLMFFPPRQSYSQEIHAHTASGYFCIFKEPFLTSTMRESLDALPMFRPGGRPAYLLEEKQELYLQKVFRNITEEVHSDYLFRVDLLRNYVMELLHYTLKMHPANV